LSLGRYYGGRTPADGRIDWRLPAQRIHDLVRGTTRPFPGAFSLLGRSRLNVWRTTLLEIAEVDPIASDVPLPRLLVSRGWVVATCGDGRKLRLLEFDIDGVAGDAVQFARMFPKGAALMARQTPQVPPPASPGSER
jgi:methionyl-tRNA formyltransferase